MLKRANIWEAEPQKSSAAQTEFERSMARARPIILVRPPRLNYELPPVKRGEHLAWSVALHAAAILVLFTISKLMPSPHVEPTRTTQVTPIYLPAPVVPKLIQPPPKVLAELKPPKITLPPPAPEPPKIKTPPPEVAKAPEPVPPKPQPKIEPKKVVETGSFDAVPVPVRPEPKKKEKEVVTDSFASGSSAAPTINKPAREVQTGGFGDPNGVKGTSDSKRSLTVANVGAFDMPSGPGKGNGTGGAHGVPGTVASAGFGDGVAGVGQGDHSHRGSVKSSGFGDMTATASGPTRAHGEGQPHALPVEILFKPKPAYTMEARQLRVEGEVLVEVMFAASGELHVQRVVRGLGHGLDESALRAAQQIRFHPAKRDGQPYDSTALVHIVFELAE